MLAVKSRDTTAVAGKKECDDITQEARYRARRGWVCSSDSKQDVIFFP